MVTVRSHHKQTRPALADLVEQDFGGRDLRCDRVEPMGRRMGGEKVAGEPQDGFRLRPVMMDGHHVDLIAESEAEELKRLQRARGFAAAAISDEDAMAIQ